MNNKIPKLNLSKAPNFKGSKDFTMVDEFNRGHVENLNMKPR